jgi:uncharacterized membrane protein
VTQSAPSNDRQPEVRWPVSVVLASTIVLHLVLPERYIIGGHFAGPALELALLLWLTALNPNYINRHTPQLRRLALAVAVAFSLINVYSVLRLVTELAVGAWTSGAPALLLTGGAIWLSNVIVTALWYWEHDRGGPAARHTGSDAHPSFLFPQMASPEFAPSNWRPTFFDYLYLSFTNASAFSPTDVLPLKRWAKMLMMAQSALSLMTLAMVIARAINTL